MKQSVETVVISGAQLNAIKVVFLFLIFVTMAFLHGQIVTLQASNPRELRDKIILLEEKVSWTEEQILRMQTKDN